MKDKLTLQQKKDILTNKGKTGGKYCNAIDENPYDSSEWNNYMPASGWHFAHSIDSEDTRIKVYWEQVFACYDGWDSSIDEDSSEYFDNMEQAVNCIWTRQAVDEMFDFITALKHSAKIKSSSKDKNMILDIESRPFNNGTRSEINTFDMDELLDNLISNVYPILRGKENKEKEGVKNDK